MISIEVTCGTCRLEKVFGRGNHYQLMLTQGELLIINHFNNDGAYDLISLGIWAEGIVNWINNSLEYWVGRFLNNL